MGLKLPLFWKWYQNQPLQQNLTKEQAAILVNAGDNQELMIAPSAYPDLFRQKFLYKKIVYTVEVFEYSNDPGRAVQCSI
jgi:hypothetical protein